MRLYFLTAMVLVGLHLNAQKFKATESSIRFFSEAPMENIEAVNEKASSVMDLATGNIVFSVPINKFNFDKSLMQEHFNENYLETDKYPKALFIGKMSTTDLKEGENAVTVSGEMDLHGVKKQISVMGIVKKQGDKLTVNSVFTLMLVDYKIKIPKAVFYNIAEEIEVTVSFTYEKI